MLSKPKHVMFLCAAVLLLLFTSFIDSYAESVNYAYDDLNRVIRVFHDDGKYIEYAYDEVGNRTEKTSIIDLDAPVSVAIPASRGFTTTISVALSCTDGTGSGCDKIYYTTDGSTPNTSSPVYTASLTMENTTTLRFFAVDRAGHTESPNTETYTYDIIPPVTTASPPGGNFASTVSVTLTCNDGSGSGCDKIYYTTDGSKPTIASAVYTAPIQITGTTKLKFFATDLATNQEIFQTQVYIINSIPPDGSMLIAGNSNPFYTLQDAYNAAADGDVIHIQNYNFIQNLNVDRNISVSLEGGYNSEFTAIIGSTYMQGKLRTYPNGGTITIKNFILDKDSTPSAAIRIIGSQTLFFNTLQDAYNVAANGDVIQVQNDYLTENIDVNKDVLVTIEGGYNSDFTAVTGSTSLKGMIQTYPNGGTLTIKNFVLENN